MYCRCVESASVLCTFRVGKNFGIRILLFTFGKFCGTYALVDRTESGLKMKFFSGTWLATYLPRFSSGIKRMFLVGSFDNFTAFAEVTHTSEWLF